MLGKKHVRDIKPPGRENSVRPTFPLGDVTISVCKDSFPLEFPALLYRTMRRGKQQLGFLLSACATKPPFTRGTSQIMHIQHKRNYVVSGITFDNKGQYSNNMVSSCAGCMKRTLPSKFLWLFFVAIYCSSIMLPWHQQRHQREPTSFILRHVGNSHLWNHLTSEFILVRIQLLFLDNFCAEHRICLLVGKTETSPSHHNAITAYLSLS